MTCTNPEISDQILAWLDGALSPSEAERFRMHVESCPSCQAAARDLSDLTKRVSRAYAAQRQTPLASACPSAEDLIDFASGTTPPRRAAGIERHLAVCEPCREQVEGLAELDATPAADIGDAPRMPTALRDAFRAAHPARVATPTADEAARPSVPSAAMTPRPGGGRGWGMRRILAAVATFTVIIGVSTLLLVRPDMFGARPTESDEVRQSVSPSRSIPERTLDVEPGTAGAPPADTDGQAGSSYGADKDNVYQPSPAEAHPAPPASGRAAAKVASAPAGGGGGVPANGRKGEATATSAGRMRPVTPPAPTAVEGEKASAPAPKADGRLAAGPAPAANVAVPVAKAPAPAPTVAAPVVNAPKPSMVGSASKAPATEPVAGPAARTPASAPVAKASDPFRTAPSETKASTPLQPPSPNDFPVRLGSSEASSSSASSAGGSVATETARRPEPTPTASQKSAPGGRAAAARDAATGPAGRETPGERYTQQMDEPVVAERAGGASQGPTAGVPAMEAPPGGDAAPAAPARNAAVATPAGRPRVQSAPAPASATRVASGGPPVQPSLLGRARAAVTRVMGRGDLVVRVIVEPASASSEQVRRVRVEVVLSGALRDQGAEVRRELFRALPLDAGRGDEVVIIAD